MRQKEIEHETWLDLSKAADYLGVHFTTLRRWADSGKIPYIRTPGGRRRFSLKVLETFIQHISQGSAAGLAVVPAPHVRSEALPPALQPIEQRAIDIARQSVRTLSSTENWLGRMNEEQRLLLKGTGHHLMALLLQYNSRTDGVEAYLDEGRRITGEYGRVCSRVGMSLPETVHVFLYFRRSILDAIHQTAQLGDSQDVDGARLFYRTTEFLDDLLLSLISSYLNLQAQIE